MSTIELRSPAQRLKTLPGVQRVPTAKLELFIVRNFLEPETCMALMERIDVDRRRSDIADDIGVADFRTSETCDLNSRDPLVAAVDRKISDALGLPLELA